MAYTDINSRAGKGSRLEHQISTRVYCSGYEAINWKRFSRICPSCKKEIAHKTLKSRNRAERLGKTCFECSKPKIGAAAVTHGMSRHIPGGRHPLYACWTAMIQRCTNKRCKACKNYGKRGVCVCLEWAESFETFMKWANEHGWAPGLQIDRKNNDWHYEPGNCRFVTPKVNSNNRQQHRELKTCTECDGYGELPFGKAAVMCKVCDGTGKLIYEN